MMTDELSERLHTEAVARITWGDLPEEVAETLAAQGMDYSEAVRLVNQLAMVRNREVRARSLRRLTLGSGALLIGIVFFAILPWKQWYDGFALRGPQITRRTHTGDWMVLVFLWIGVAGLWYVWRGFWGLMAPQAEELSDVE